MAPRVVYQTAEREAPIIPFNLLPNPPWNRGNYYYGSSWSWYYPGPYYGGPYDTDGARLPYVAAFTAIAENPGGARPAARSAAPSTTRGG